MYYDKQIRYIDYLENGEKQRNCGYVKVTVTDNRLLLDMQIKGLYETDDVASEVALEGAGAERRIGTILIQQGSGSFQWEAKDSAHVGEALTIGEGLCYGQLERVHVQLSPRRSLRCVWREGISKQELARQGQVSEPQAYGTGETMRTVTRRSKEDDAVQVYNLEASAPEVATERERGVVEDAVTERDSERTVMRKNVTEREGEKNITRKIEAERDTADGNEMDRSETESAMVTGADSTENQSGNKAQNEARSKAGRETENALGEAELHQADGPDLPGETGSAPERLQAPQPPQMASMSEDKWQQLWKIYPHIRPFQDEREYLSLRPEDFVILHSSAYRLAQNSFLLHGYFNYDHLVLTRVSQRNGNQYYIGVPGNFYEKEKQVAIMYGFGSFECRREPAQEGDFGYYMIKVEL